MRNIRHSWKCAEIICCFPGKNISPLPSPCDLTTQVLSSQNSSQQKSAARFEAWASRTKALPSTTWAKGAAPSATSNSRLLFAGERDMHFAFILGLPRGCFSVLGRRQICQALAHFRPAHHGEGPFLVKLSSPV